MRKFVSVFLSVLMVMLSSVNSSASVTSVDQGTFEQDQAVSSSTRVCELTELREKNSETYLLSDGKYECVVYPEDKYYSTKGGNLEEIDNSLVPIEYQYDDYHFAYRNKASDTLCYFSDDKPICLLQFSNRQISFKAENTLSTNSFVGGNQEYESIFGYELAGENCLLYNEPLPDVDFLYAVQNNAVKEFIVLKGSAANSSISYLVEGKGYSYIVDNNSVKVLAENNELIFEFGSLFAVDANGVYTDDIAYEVEQLDENCARIKIVVSPVYLSSRERAFPVLIDPSIMITGASSTYDSFVSSTNASANYYMDTTVCTGKSSSYGVRRTYIKFALPDSVYNKYPVSAYISIRKKDGADPSIKAYRVTSSWASSSITWNNKPGYSSTYCSGTAIATTNSWYRVFVTQIVRCWMTNRYSNYGFLIKDNSESSTSQWTDFYSSDAASPNKPELRIIYVNTDTSLYALLEYDGVGGAEIIRDAFFNDVNSYVTTYRKASTYQLKYDSINLNIFKAALKSTLILFIHTHGMTNKIAIGVNSQGGYNWIDSSDLVGQDLSNLKFVVLLTCWNGYGGYSPSRVANGNPANMMERLLVCGAETVLAFSDEAPRGECNRFASYLAKYMIEDGLTVQQAINQIAANNGTINVGTLLNIYVIGGNASKKIDW